MTDMMWTADARTRLAEQARAAAAALEAHAQALQEITDEDSFDLAAAVRRDIALRDALRGYDDAAFDLSGSFPICLEEDEAIAESDEDAEMDAVPGGFEAVTAMNGRAEEAGFVSLVIRADLVVTDPQALADAVAAQRGEAGTDVADNVDAVVEDVLSHELFQVPGLQELRKAVFPLVTDELESDESFEADPLGIVAG